MMIVTSCPHGSGEIAGIANWQTKAEEHYSPAG